MKQCFSILFCSALLLAGLSSGAQKLSKKASFGFGLEGGAPLGDAKNSYNFTGGLTLRFSYKAGPGFATFTTGAVVFGPKSISGGHAKAGLQIPFKAGYKYIIGGHFFVMGELGYSVFRYYYEDGNHNLVSTSTGGFTYAPTVGVQFGSFEVGIKYEGIAISGGTLSDVGLRLGFNF
jgi:hypothetical protein